MVQSEITHSFRAFCIPSVPVEHRCASQQGSPEVQQQWCRQRGPPFWGTTVSAGSAAAISTQIKAGLYTHVYIYMGWHLYSGGPLYCSQFQVACSIVKVWKYKLTNQMQAIPKRHRVRQIWLVSLFFVFPHNVTSNLKLTVKSTYTKHTSYKGQRALILFQFHNIKLYINLRITE